MFSGGIEKGIARALDRCPRTRGLIKSGYKWLNYYLFGILLAKKEFSSQAEPVARNGSQHLFFGYYGKHQINSNRKALVCATDSDAVVPGPNDRLKILIGELSNPTGFRHVADTTAWNWQQGCMLQWLEAYPDDAFIFNDYHTNGFASRIFDVATGKSREIPMPIYCVSRCNRFALSLNFSRLYRMNPAYGYCNGSYELVEPAPENDGIWRVNLDSGKADLIISLRQLADLKPKESMAGAVHKVNHIEIAPDGRRFMVIHRWMKKGVKYSRLVTAGTNGSDVCILSDNGVVSHCAWKSSGEILAWARTPDGFDRYSLFLDRSTQWSAIGNGTLRVDGHPSFSPDRRWILTDTYPDRLRMKTLMLYSIADKRMEVLGRFFAPFRFDGIRRCDLHPRWSACGCYVSFDSCHEGVRRSYFLDVSDITGLNR